MLVMAGWRWRSWLLTRLWKRQTGRKSIGLLGPGADSDGVSRGNCRVGAAVGVITTEAADSTETTARAAAAEEAMLIGE